VTRQHTAAGRTRAVGVIIPANDEERLLPASLEALERAVLRVKRLVPRAHVVVVLDSCKDASAAITRAWNQHVDQTLSSFRVSLLEMDGENVGRARALGCEHVLAEFSDIALERIWLATTDADTRVPTDWLLAQIRQHDSGVDAWAGRVAVTEWPAHRLAVATKWQRDYDAEARPIHGASFGLNARMYVDVGGFPSLRTSEDRALHLALVAAGARIHYDASVPVVTSARRVARAPHGFATALTRAELTLRII
jgi:cellulose synthase/poly-beta-1,6-N-acetylglucosamine synthase-like glycosyltransferase